jgi:hypothetical protein
LQPSGKKFSWVVSIFLLLRWCEYFIVQRDYYNG